MRPAARTIFLGAAIAFGSQVTAAGAEPFEPQLNGAAALLREAFGRFRDEGTRRARRPPPITVPQNAQQAALQALERGAAYLLKVQSGEGSWRGGNWNYREPDVRIPVTVLCLQALETRDATPELRWALARAESYVAENPGRPETPEERQGVNSRLYQLIYGLEFSVSQSRSPKEDPAVLAALDGIARADWAYYRNDGYASLGPASFQLAMLAIALEEAKALGCAMPAGPYGKDLLEAALADLEKARSHEQFNYFRGRTDAKRRIGTSLESSAARSVIGELALYLGGRCELERLDKAVGIFMRDREKYEAVLKTKVETHDSKGFAKYYYPFGIYWTSRALSALAEAGEPQAPGIARGLLEAVLKAQRADGSWLDSPEFAGPSYGTATAMLSIELLRPLAFPGVGGS